MSEPGGFIVIHRKITEWEWYTDSNTKSLFLHCLLKANYEDKHWRGILVKRGSFITSLSTLAKETGMSVQSVRTALQKLESTGEIASEATNRYRIIIVKKYDGYQTLLNRHPRNNNQSTSKQQAKQQASNNQSTTTNNINNNNNRTREGVRPTGAPPSPRAAQKPVLYSHEWLAYGLSLGKSEEEIWQLWEAYDSGRDLPPDTIVMIKEAVRHGSSA